MSRVPRGLSLRRPVLLHKVILPFDDTRKYLLSVCECCGCVRHQMTTLFTPHDHNIQKQDSMNEAASRDVEFARVAQTKYSGSVTVIQERHLGRSAAVSPRTLIHLDAR